MAEQVIDPAKPILSIRDREIMEQGNALTYRAPTGEKPGENLDIILRRLYGDELTPEPKDFDFSRDTNLLPFKPVTKGDLDRFNRWCARASENEEYSPRIGQSILQVTDAYLRQICLFVNSHSPVRNRRDDYPTMAYLPHDFWNPPTNPPSEAYIEERAEYIRTTARLPPQRLKALTHLFIHIAPRGASLSLKQDSALLVITPRAATIEYFDVFDHPSKHIIMGDIMSVISRVDPDRSSAWLELADWKCRAGASGGSTAASGKPEEEIRFSQVYVCNDALAQAFGYDVNMYCRLQAGQTWGHQTEHDALVTFKTWVIVLDLYHGYFSNVIGDPQYRPRIKRIFGRYRYEAREMPKWMDNPRQLRNYSPWLHFSEKVYRRFLPRELAQWNGENRWRGLKEEDLYEKARLRMLDPRKANRYDDAPRGTELGEFGKAMEWKRARRLRMWLEDKDIERNRMDRYHSPAKSVGWNVGGNLPWT